MARLYDLKKATGSALHPYDIEFSSHDGNRFLVAAAENFGRAFDLSLASLEADLVAGIAGKGAVLELARADTTAPWTLAQRYHAA